MAFKMTCYVKPICYVVNFVPVGYIKNMVPPLKLECLQNKVYNTITEQIKVHKTYSKIGITPPESW